MKKTAVVGFTAKEYRSRGLETCFGSSSADDVQLVLVRVGVDEESVVRWKVHFREQYAGVEKRIHITPFQGQVRFPRGDCAAEVWIRINEIDTTVKEWYSKKTRRIEELMYHYMWGIELDPVSSFEFEVHLEAGDTIPALCTHGSKYGRVCTCTTLVHMRI